MPHKGAGVRPHHTHRYFAVALFVFLPAFCHSSIMLPAPNSCHLVKIFARRGAVAEKAGRFYTGVSF